jgi:hypothetical protein
MNPKAVPPRWADAVLRSVLDPAGFDSVSGDLIEEYRESVEPARGRPGADRWYVQEVAGFVLRAVGPWGLALGAASVTRTALDWLAPPIDFHARSVASSYLALSLIAGSGVHMAWRSGRIASGAVAGLAATAISAVTSIAGTAILLAIWHDEPTRAAIRQSGGLEEAFTLPLVHIVGGAVLGMIGGGAGVALRRGVNGHA